MKKTITVIILVAFVISCKNKHLKEIQFNFREYTFNNQIDSLLKRSKNYDLAAQQYSFISEHKKVIQSLDNNKDTIKSIGKKNWNAILDHYDFKDAEEYIIEKAKNHDFLMLNEAHSIAQHRNFVKKLLPELVKIEYKYLAIETITVSKNGKLADNNIETRGYPTIHSGFYTQEPEMSNLIREAIQLGYRIIGYDVRSGGKQREIDGAKNIINRINELGNQGKTIILCGWDHIKEGKTDTYWEYALAGRIKEYTGKNPLTVNQTLYSEKSKRIYEDSIYQLANVSKPSILINNNDQSFNVEKNPNWYDLMVFHPRTVYIDDIPNWIVEDMPIKTIQLPELNINFPCKIFVYDKQDDINKAFPLYIKEIHKITSEINLPIPLSEYKIVISNKKKSYLIEQ